MAFRAEVEPVTERANPVAGRRSVFKALMQEPLSAAGVAVVALFVLLTLLAPWLSPSPADAYGAVHPGHALLPPLSPGHPLGTTQLGQDLLTLVLFGGRISLLAAAAALAAALVIGVPLGALAGYLGGAVDELIMRFTDVVLAFPSMLLALAIAAALGPSLANAVLAIALTWWPWYTRLVRSQVMVVKSRGFVEAGRLVGVSTPRMLVRHVVPNALTPLIVQSSMDYGSVILTLASLSFLGLGAQPPTPEWGLLVSEGRNYVLNAWWYVTFPGLAIFLVVAALNFIGDGLHEALATRRGGDA
jgi:peptide/nickel transport system permease protein